MAAMAAAPTLDLVVFVLLGVAVLQTVLWGPRDAVARLRGPAVAATLIVLALVFVRVVGPDQLDRFAAVGLVAGLAAGVGLLPYAHAVDADDEYPGPAALWIAFVGPVLAAVLVLRSREFLPAGAGGDFGGMLIGLGLVNVLWGTVAAWRTQRGRAAWHYSFMSDWGLALCGFGITVADGQSAALLILLAILLARFPLLMSWRDAPEEDVRSGRLAGLLVGAILAGLAPFGGFAGRVLLLRGATEIFWPLAVVLAIGMLLWLPASLRLGRSIGQYRGRQAIALAALVAANLALGIYPLPLFALGGM
jgi:NADH:ubiquinone oxidoreductase subunit 2 (subunit N)